MIHSYDPGLFRPCADGGSRCSSSKIAHISLSQPTGKHQASRMPHVFKISTATTSIKATTTITVPVKPFSTPAANLELCINSKSSVVGTSPWLSLMTFALCHFSENLLAVTLPLRSLKSCFS